MLHCSYLMVTHDNHAMSLPVSLTMPYVYKRHAINVCLDESRMCFKTVYRTVYVQSFVLLGDISMCTCKFLQLFQWSLNMHTPLLTSLCPAIVLSMLVPQVSSGSRCLKTV